MLCAHWAGSTAKRNFWTIFMALGWCAKFAPIATSGEREHCAASRFAYLPPHAHAEHPLLPCLACTAN
jgi:hypothetical protein